MFFSNQQFLGIFSIDDADVDFRIGNPVYIVEANLIRAVATVIEPLSAGASMTVKFGREKPDGSIQMASTNLVVNDSAQKGQQVRVFSRTGLLALTSGDVLVINIITDGDPTTGKIALWGSFVARR